MDVANEILDAIEIIVDKKTKEQTTQIYPGICKSVSGNSCVMSINGKDNTVQFYGSAPTVGAIYRVFVPNGNMSTAFIISGGASESGGGENDVFYATYGTTTNAEILAAYEAGKAVYLKVGGNYGVYRLLFVGSSIAYFGGITSNRQFARYRCSDDTWTTYEHVPLAPMATSVAVTLTASGWDSSAKIQTVMVPGILADETKQLITPTPAIADQDIYYESGILCTNQRENNLVFTAETIPAFDLTVYVTIQEVSAS